MSGGEADLPSDVPSVDQRGLPSAGSVLGIDVGCSTSRRSSAVCRLDWTASQITWSIARFRASEPERADTIRKIAGDAYLSAAAFDGPLRRGLDVIGRYRTAERMLTRRLRPFIGKPGQSSAPIGKALNAAANACADIVVSGCNVAEGRRDIAIHEKAIAEAFPSSFLGLMIEDPVSLEARRGDRSDTFFKHLTATGGLMRLLLHLLPKRTVAADLILVTNHDDRAALVCALTALCFAAGEFVTVGNEDGWIVLPPAALVRPWAMTALERNTAEDASNSLLVVG